MMPNELMGKVEASAAGVSITTGTGTNLPGRYDLGITHGADWQLVVTWIDATDDAVDLSSGYTATFTIYDQPSGSVVALITDGDGVTLAATAPNLIVDIEESAIADYTWGPRAVYALAVTASGLTTLLLVGAVVLRGN